MTAEEKTEYYTTTTYTMTTSTITVPGLESSLSEDDKKAVQEDNVLAATIELDEKSEIVTAKAEYDENGNHISFTRSKAESSIVYKMDFIFVMPFVAIINFLQVSQTKRRMYDPKLMRK